MAWTARVALSLRILLTALALVLALWADVRWWTLAAVAFLAALSSAADLVGVTQRTRVGKWMTGVAWISSLVAVMGFWFGHKTLTLDPYHGVCLWIVAALLSLPGARSAAWPTTEWKRLAMAWALAGGVVWVAAAYLQNLTGSFYFGLLALVVLLLFCKRLIQARTASVIAVNSFILFLIGLPLVEVFYATRRPAQLPGPRQRNYSFEVGRKHPVEYVRWCRALDLESKQLLRAIVVIDEKRWYRLKPDSEGRLFENHIRINHLGFRGREITADKGAAYRIVALGESTTFGYTFEAGDRPWPEVLEQLIAERLKPRRPVEVINAGTPGFNLAMNLRRLESEILPLKPDMIISYHGFNGFTSSNLLASSRSPVRGAPAYQNRPTKLLADCEYSLKLTFYNRQQSAAHRPAALTIPDPLKTGYATAYRRLIELAQTNGIRLVIGNYSMAVNEQSQPEAIQFYDRRFPGVGWYIKANAVHSEILRRLAPQYSDVTFVDTHPLLDGEYARFTDLVHLTQEGRQQMAEVLYAGVERILKEDLDRNGGPREETR